MEFTQDLIRSLHSSAVFEGIPVKDLRDLLREIDARIIELSEGQLLRRAGDRMDFYPVVVSGIVQASMPQGGQDRQWRSSARASRSPRPCRRRLSIRR